MEPSNINNNKMHGVISGVYVCNNGIQDEMNNKLFERNLPSANLQPQYSIRPTSTKYGYMQILDQRQQATTPLRSYGTYNIKTTFNPGSAQAPWSGFSNNVNNESMLRNQFFALQNCEQAQFIPSSKSDLYETKIDYKQVIQNHPLLFEEPDLAPFNPNTSNVGKNIFNNHTRHQLKET